MNRFSAIVVLLIIGLFACKKEKEKKDTFSSSQNLFVEFVSAYTSGHISSKDEIKIKLAKSVDKAEPGQKILTKLFSFEPSIKGSAYWEDNRTAVFKPDNKLVSGQEYKAKFALKDIVETPEGREEFKFTFTCIPQNYDVKVEGLFLYDEKTLDEVMIKGILQSADITEDAEMEKILKAKQDGKVLAISYEHGLGQNQHKFTIEKVSRKDKKGQVEISWDGGPINVNKKGDLKYEIPSLSDFTVSNVKIIRTDDNYISILFSDPIDVKQNLRGIVRLSSGTNPRVVVNLNELKIYPTSRLSGSVILMIDKSLKNKAGYALEDDFNTTLQFSQLKPEVKMATNKGVIMPGSEGLIIPFEAASLSAVDFTIVRIFENNVLQYLQNNRVGNTSQLQRVGRPIARKTLPLSTMGVSDLNQYF